MSITLRLHYATLRLRNITLPRQWENNGQAISFLCRRLASHLQLN